MQPVKNIEWDVQQYRLDISQMQKRINKIKLAVMIPLATIAGIFGGWIPATVVLVAGSLIHASISKSVESEACTKWLEEKCERQKPTTLDILDIDEEHRIIRANFKSDQVDKQNFYYLRQPLGHHVCLVKVEHQYKKGQLKLYSCNPLFDDWKYVIKIQDKTVEIKPCEIEKW